MELLQQLVINMLSRGEVVLTLQQDAVEFLNHRCLEILERIRQIIADDSLDDPECFQRIERIVCVLEEYGIDCGARHDFG